AGLKMPRAKIIQDWEAARTNPVAFAVSSHAPAGTPFTTGAHYYDRLLNPLVGPSYILVCACRAGGVPDELPAPADPPSADPASTDPHPPRLHRLHLARPGGLPHPRGPPGAEQLRSVRRGHEPFPCAAHRRGTHAGCHQCLA